MKLALVAFALLALAMASACGSADNVDAPTVSIDTLEIVVGEQSETVLAVLEFDSPGLGAWTVDIQYDNGVVSVIECEPLPEGNVCNPAYTDDTVRVVGATGTGLEGDTLIGRITFQCDVAAESELDIIIDLLADGTLGDPREIVPIIENGAITCTE